MPFAPEGELRLSTVRYMKVSGQALRLKSLFLWIVSAEFQQSSAGFEARGKRMQVLRQ